VLHPAALLDGELLATLVVSLRCLSLLGAPPVTCWGVCCSPDVACVVEVCKGIGGWHWHLCGCCEVCV